MAVTRVALQAALAQLAAGKIFADSNGLLVSDPGIKIVHVTHDVANIGNQAITGAGFPPKSAVILATITGTSAMSIGLYDGTSSVCIDYLHQNSANTYDRETTFCIFLNTANGVYSQAAGNSLDSDGITLNWSKTGLPTGTADLYLLLLR